MLNFLSKKLKQHRLKLLMVSSVLLFLVIFTPMLSFAAEASPSLFSWAGIKQKASNLISNAITGNPSCGFGCEIVSSIGRTILRVSAFVMWLTAVLFNFVIHYTLVEMKSSIEKLGALDVGWTTFRDLANIFFVFILLYIGIGTILRLEGVNAKKMLSGVIVIALLINFSLFFTKLIIDGSNIFTMAFFNKITVDGNQIESDPSSGGAYSNNTLANAFAKPLGLASLFSTPTTEPADGLVVFKDDNYPAVFLVALLSSVFLLVTAFVFFACCVLFVIRYVVLVFLMLLSPLAFAGMILPKTRGMISDKWWKTLFDQALFAPVFFMLLWVIVQIISSDAFVPKTTLGAGFADLLYGNGDPKAVGIVLNFLVIIVFMIAALIISKTFASSGGSAVAGAVKWGNQAMGKTFAGGSAWALRNTAGRAATALSESTRFKNFAANNALGRVAYKGVAGAAKSSFDARGSALGKSLAGATGTDLGKAQEGGFKKTVEEKAKAKAEFAKELGKASFSEKQRIDELNAQKTRLSEVKLELNRANEQQIEARDEAREEVSRRETERQRQEQIRAAANGTDPQSISIRNQANARIATLDGELTTFRATLSGLNTALQGFDAQIEQIDEDTETIDDNIKEVKHRGTDRQTDYANEMSRPRILNLGIPSRASLHASMDIRKETQKSQDQRLLDEIKKFASDNK